MRILLVEPFLGGSHQAWAEGYAQHSEHDVTVLGHAGHSWKWRMRGSWATLADQAGGLGEFDAIIASSLLDTARFLGATRAFLGRTPVVQYMHENQLTYPLREGRAPDVEHVLTNWAATLVADEVWFNSRFHLDSWYASIPGVLGRYRGDSHTALVDGVQSRSLVMPLGVDLEPFDDIPRTSGSPPLIVWNQRWEYDKGLSQLDVALRGLVSAGVDFRVAFLGESPASPPKIITNLIEFLGERTVQAGFADTGLYRRLLRSADIVVSTADHEFFGIAVTEAIYAGATPLLPNRVVYPERIPSELQDRVLFDNTPHLIQRLVDLVGSAPERSETSGLLRSSVGLFDWSVVGPQYDDRLTSIVQGSATA
ncbi:MAG: DUF3524 domain-containing protein [Acidobacteria bacterium]|nr:DUF3524 domain-containing protein [Acidobacteriota bacterium]